MLYGAFLMLLLTFVFFFLSSEQGHERNVRVRCFAV